MEKPRRIESKFNVNKEMQVITIDGNSNSYNNSMMYILFYLFSK